MQRETDCFKTVSVNYDSDIKMLRHIRHLKCCKLYEDVALNIPGVSISKMFIVT
jgi:hypothetical protein